MEMNVTGICLPESVWVCGFEGGCSFGFFTEILQVLPFNHFMLGYLKMGGGVQESRRGKSIDFVGVSPLS